MWAIQAVAGSSQHWQLTTGIPSVAWCNRYGLILSTPASGLVASLINPADFEVATDLLAKKTAGYRIVLNDIYGCLLSEQFLQGDDGDVTSTFSGIASASAFASNHYPFAHPCSFECRYWCGSLHGDNATHVEITPYEFGSWDEGIAAFTPTQYLDTQLYGGQPSETDHGACITGFGNVGYMLGTSSNLFNVACDSNARPAPNLPIVGDIVKYVEGQIEAAPIPSTKVPSVRPTQLSQIARYYP
jgi:Lysophospholipase catalytic domain